MAAKVEEQAIVSPLQSAASPRTPRRRAPRSCCLVCRAAFCYSLALGAVLIVLPPPPPRCKVARERAATIMATDYAPPDDPWAANAPSAGGDGGTWDDDGGGYDIPAEYAGEGDSGSVLAIEEHIPSVEDARAEDEPAVA